MWKCSGKGTVKLFCQCSNLQHCVWLALNFFFSHVFAVPESCHFGERWFYKVKRHFLVCFCKLAFCWSVVLYLSANFAMPACLLLLCPVQKENI